VDFSWIGPAMHVVGTYPAFLQVGVLVLLCYIVYSAREWARLRGQSDMDEPDPTEELRIQVDSLELHLTNHLTTEVARLADSLNEMSVTIKEATAETRNMVEQTNRSVNTMIIVLEKVDELDKSLDTIDKSIIRLEGRVGSHA
jgi:hypothetical protein